MSVLSNACDLESLLLMRETVKSCSHAARRFNTDIAIELIVHWQTQPVLQVGDSRWRSSQSAGTEVVEGLLNSLQTYTDFIGQHDEEPTPSMQGEKAQDRPVLSLDILFYLECVCTKKTTGLANAIWQIVELLGRVLL